MVTNVLELATTLKYLGANWLPEKKVNLTPCQIQESDIVWPKFDGK